jgi:hypothetical protein
MVPFVVFFIIISNVDAVVYMLLYNHSTEVTGDGVLSACSSKPSVCSADYDAVASRNADYSIKEGEISDLLTSTRGFDWNLTAENYEIWSIYGRLATSWANWFTLGKPTTGIFSTGTTIWTGKHTLFLFHLLSNSFYQGSSSTGAYSSSACTGWTVTTGNGTVWTDGTVGTSLCATSHPVLCICLVNSTTSHPSHSPTMNPTNPTSLPTSNPSKNPSKNPTTKSPTKSPTESPTTASPTKNPTNSPTNPTTSPTRSPSKPCPVDGLHCHVNKYGYCGISQFGVRCSECNYNGYLLLYPYLSTH